MKTKICTEYFEAIDIVKEDGKCLIDHALFMKYIVSFIHDGFVVSMHKRSINEHENKSLYLVTDKRQYSNIR